MFLGEIPLFTGISSPYEIPTHPDLIIKGSHSLEEGIQTIVQYLQTLNLVPK